jgi:MraZ protein
MPVRFRHLLGETFTITKGTDGCLFVLTQDGYLELEKSLHAQKRPLDHHANRLLRWFCGEAAEASVDEQGRMQIPGNLRDHAEIKKEVVIVGLGKRVEVWSRERWNEFNAKLTDEAIAESAFEVKLSF